MDDIVLMAYSLLVKIMRKFVEYPAGRHNVAFNVGNIPAGLYKVKMKVEGEIFTHSILVAK